MSAYAISSRGLASRRMPQSILTPMNTLLFGAGQQGAWGDPTDLSTQFQDSAGTTPVTAVEQLGGKILDKSGNGNHETQSTSTARPVLSARVNLLTNTDLSGFVAGFPGTPPTGWFNDATTGSLADNFGAIKFVAVGQQRAIKYFFIASVGSTYQFTLVANTPSAWLQINQAIRLSGIVGTITYQIDGSPAVASDAIPAGNHVISLTIAVTAVTTPVLVIGAGVNSNVNGEVSIKSVSYVSASKAHLPYQRVNTPTDYDTVGFPKYWTLDGVDDYWTSATGGGGTAGFFFSAVISPLGGAGTVRVVWSDAGTNTGYIVRLNASNQLEIAAGNGTTYTTVATTATLAVGDINVCQAWDDGTNLNVRIGTGLSHLLRGL